MVKSEPTKDFMGLWIIEKESGMPLLSVSLEENENKIDSVLFGGFMVAIRNLITDFQIGQLTSFSTSISKLLLTGGKNLITVLSISKDSNADSWYPVLIASNNYAESFYEDNVDTSELIDTSIFEELEAELKILILIQCSKTKELLDKENDSEAKKAKEKLEDSGLW